MENRELKFRAWDSENKYMVDPSVYIISFSGVPFFDNRGDVIEQSKKLSLMQFTGVTDKNGKEIFERDVISNGTVRWTVEYFLGAFWLSCDDDNLDIPFNEVEKWNLLEVIGNIFENPELLKTDTDGSKN